MAHDFKKWPELRNSELDRYYFESPHKQIFENFEAKVVKVTDGDTIRITHPERDFDFPLRFLDINAPEMSESRGKQVRSWLESQILDQNVIILVDINRRVGKWGRLLGRVMHVGMDMGEMMMHLGMVTSFDERNEGIIPHISKDINIEKWLT